MLKLKNWFYERFGFSKREFNGLLGVCGLIIVLTILPYAYSYYKKLSKSLTNDDLVALQKLEFVDKQEANNFYRVRNQIDDAEFRAPANLFQFDPNTIGLEEWKQLGLSGKQASSIINYRNKGGKFYKPEDLRKMYTITPEKYQQLLPYIQIADARFRNNQTEFTKSTYVKKPLQIIEINGADTLALDEIKGIGSAFARRIAKYRERIGGFHSKEQLKEVFGLDSLKLEEIKNQITVDGSLIQKININTVQFDDLKKNPYVNFKQINAIINYRKQHGDYKNVNDLRKVLLLNEQTIQKLTPYITY